MIPYISQYPLSFIHSSDRTALKNPTWRNGKYVPSPYMAVPPPPRSKAEAYVMQF